MNGIIWISLLVLLLLAYVDRRRDMTVKMWLIVAGMFMLCQFYIDLFGLLIPAGCIAGLIYMRKAKKSYLSKALIFGLICVYANFYLPKITLTQLKEQVENAKYTAEFNQVRAVSQYSAASEVNAILQKAAEQLRDKNPKSEITIDDPHVLFSIWVLTHRDMSIQDLDWLWYTAPRELHYYWQSSRPDPLTTLEYVIFNETGYMGLFKRATASSPFLLESVYEFDRLKNANPAIP
ncbi:hypothetical protein [Paenibacillus thalictri]|uniref:Uncharacterized protein n=1 Tax=Paenibacillus thalictri TaxID=2527873 RepID=A0A4Q9DFA4_9BACL|nr:hypothetical protein [Paenibacillus thalictri]TBL70531.1 hypothetical protein EYB31_32950 [Paenibacillus thalictri]